MRYEEKTLNADYSELKTMLEEYKEIEKQLEEEFREDGIAKSDIALFYKKYTEYRI